MIYLNRNTPTVQGVGEKSYFAFDFNRPEYKSMNNLHLSVISLATVKVSLVYKWFCLYPNL